MDRSAWPIRRPFAGREPAIGDRPRGPVEVPGWRIVPATTAWRRLRGLLGRRELPPGEALWLPVRSVHTIGMRFALDLVWIDGDGAVVRIDRRVVPGRVRSCVTARGVFETGTGAGGCLAAALMAAR